MRDNQGHAAAAMHARVLGPVIVASLIAWGVAVAGPAMAAKRPGVPPVLARTQIPPSFAVGTGQPALALRLEVVDGELLSAVPAALQEANVFGERAVGDGQTMLTLRTDLAVAVKFDLYISLDGKSFVYTSSCALTPGVSAFEMWPYPVREFALGNPRLLAKGRPACD